MGFDRHTKTEHGPDKTKWGTRGGRKTAKAESRKLRRAGDALAIAEQCQTATRIGRDRWGRAGWLVWVDGRIVARGLPTAEAAREKLTTLTDTERNS